MGFPCTPDSRTRSRNDAAAVAMLLKERHDGHFMLWNAAEEGYDYSLFDNQVRARSRAARTCSKGYGARHMGVSKQHTSTRILPPSLPARLRR